MPASPSHQASCTCSMSPEPRAFTALCGGVDSRGRAAAAAGDEGGVESGHEDPLIERLILVLSGQRVLVVGEIGFPKVPFSTSIQFVSEIRNAVKYLCSCSFQLENGQRHSTTTPQPSIVPHNYHITSLISPASAIYISICLWGMGWKKALYF